MVIKNFGNGQGEKRKRTMRGEFIIELSEMKYKNYENIIAMQSIAIIYNEILRRSS